MMVLRRFLSCHKGAAAAEMALILPFALLLIYTSLEAGHYMYQRHQVVKGLRDGARYAARQPFDEINCRNGTASGIPSGIETTIKEVTRTGVLSGGSPRVKNWAVGDITVSMTCPTVDEVAESQTGLYDSTERAAIVRVSTDFTYDALFNGLGVLDDTIHLIADQQATVMGI